MEAKLDNLIEKIKKDGVDEAKKVSERLIAQAQQQAEDVVAVAREKAEVIIDQANQEAAKLKSNSESSLKQAARDLSLSLHQEIISLLDKILKRNISQELTSDFVKELILKLVNQWDKKKDCLEVLVAEKDVKQISEMVLDELNKEVVGGITIKPSSFIDKGFRIGVKGSDVYYDFSDESVLEVLKEFLNPALVAILNKK